MTSSSEDVVIRADRAAGLAPLPTPDLRSGGWTRFGGAGLLGDGVTEQTLTDLADRTRAAARSEGYAVGWAHGVRDSRAAERLALAEQQARAAEDGVRREAEHAAAVAALQAAADSLRAATTEVCRRLADQATDLAWAVTAEIVGRGAAASTPDDVVRRVLDVLPQAPMVTVRVHPQVAEHAAAGLPEGVVVVPDPALGHADAVVEVEDHVLDLRVDQALARVREVLR